MGSPIFTFFLLQLPVMQSHIHDNSLSKIVILDHHVMIHQYFIKYRGERFGSKSRKSFSNRVWICKIYRSKSDAVTNEKLFKSI